MASGRSFKDIVLHPNSLTLFRVVTIPGIILLLLPPEPSRLFCMLAAALFSLAAISDGLDGYYARSLGLVSNFGKFMDPLADKLLVMSTLTMLTWHQWIPGWMACIIVGRELAVTGLRGIAAEQGKVIAAEKLGKYKMGFQIGAIIPLLLHHKLIIAGDFFLDFGQVGYWVLWIALVFTIWSGAEYFRNYSKVIRS
ncbi:MAG: CDP-diacylglycerol--glycerol-3-phosphate 3-phosphatidyltransferase [Desulfatibacillum sp.]|nr:CDP-diacylglycerol--glycerol-3-phosphate 3-phosphatidyltransferase [Desulfatibacillum sp.]